MGAAGVPEQGRVFLIQVVPGAQEQGFKETGSPAPGPIQGGQQGIE